MITRRKARRVRSGVSVAEAQQRLIETCLPLGTEYVAFVEAADRVAAEDVMAMFPMPRFERSGVDGYAVNLSVEEGITAGKTRPCLVVTEDISAGSNFPRPLDPGTAARIMTGAEVPERATSIVMLEETDEYTKGNRLYIQLKHDVIPGRHIARIGEEWERGEVLIPQGRRLGGSDIGLLVAAGHRRIRVYRKPRVGIISIGNELLHPRPDAGGKMDEAMPAGMIHNSNGAMLAALVRQYGGIPYDYGIIEDDAYKARDFIRSVALKTDLVITTGAVSVGERDVMAEVFVRDTCLLFNKVFMRPGSPTSAGLLPLTAPGDCGDKHIESGEEGEEHRPGLLLNPHSTHRLVLGLSGNPGACFVGFELFASLCIGALQGAPFTKKDALHAFLSEPVLKGSPHPRYLQGKLRGDAGMLLAEPLPHARSSMMRSVPEATCLIVLPGGGKPALKGALVEIIPLGGFR
ncbi:hypothetical protein SY83_21785 [Paenibacillus swuensis]|uniref:Molybdopterin molybdenumtransferase n=1 Tax=Paenibacillus swuensis TaxID=1178515 RepID=A0A172TNT4_9BACL|nr:molybdopterin molybdotransferase MoeA [Paenibacillus swuensis]ANE48477.1 hypothetical protein SY83_21785 [Paenibacillus swuensis]